MTGRVDATLRRLPAWRLPAVLEPSNARSPWWTWAVTRAFMLLAVGFAQESVVGDVAYYGRSLYAMFRHGAPLRETLQEYPLPVFGVLLPQFLASGLNPLVFGFLFIASMLAVDGLFLRHLLRARTRLFPEQSGTRGAVALWVWFVPLMGPITYFRFDLVPAVLAGAAVTALLTNPARAGWFTALGAGLKLWPAALLPSLLARCQSRKRTFVGFLVGGVIVLGASLLIGGLPRLLSPLQWQSDRGLQIESVFALPLMVGRTFSRSTWNIHVSPYKAWEIFGPGAHGLTTASTVATGLTVLWLIWTWARAFRLPAVSTEVVGWLVFTTVAVLTVVNKTLSPQYVIWLGGPLAALLLRRDRTRDPALRRVVVSTLVVAGLTQVIYPVVYQWILNNSRPPWEMPVAITLLAVRNLLLVAITGIACHRVWQLTRVLPASGASTGSNPSTASTSSGEVPAAGEQSRAFAQVAIVSLSTGDDGRDDLDDDDAQSLSSTA